jgi:hypothetical protein
VSYRNAGVRAVRTVRRVEIVAGIGIDGPWSAPRGLIHVMRPPIEWIGAHLPGLHVDGTQVGSDSAFQ